MIYTYDNATQTRWNRGELQVEIRLPNNTRPMGYCDGTEADEQEIRDMGESEGAIVDIQKKRLKTGREIWTIASSLA